MKNFGLSFVIVGLNLLLSSVAWAGADWNKDRVCFGDQIYVYGMGECHVVAEYGENRVHVVDSESKVREVDLTCQRYMKLNKNLKFWEAEDAETVGETPRLRRRPIRHSEWQRALQENGPDESLRDPILEEILQQR